MAREDAEHEVIGDRGLGLGLGHENSSCRRTLRTRFDLNLFSIGLLRSYGYGDFEDAMKRASEIPAPSGVAI